MEVDLYIGATRFCGGWEWLDHKTECRLISIYSQPGLLRAHSITKRYATRLDRPLYKFRTYRILQEVTWTRVYSDYRNNGPSFVQVCLYSTSGFIWPLRRSPRSAHDGSFPIPCGLSPQNPNDLVQGSRRPRKLWVPTRPDHPLFYQILLWRSAIRLAYPTHRAVS